MSTKSPLPASFIAKKGKILAQLAVPASEYDDLSPKGSIDAGIRDLIDEINACEGFVTTSSCGGRISVFAEGDKSLSSATTSSILDGVSEPGNGEDISIPAANVKPAGEGGKGGGGKWLFVSHDPIEVQPLEESDEEGFSLAGFLGMKDQSQKEHYEVYFNDDYKDRLRMVHFKFEPMILHILTASPQHAQIVLSAAMQAGFRESGALNLTQTGSEPATPMVAVRSMGLALESIVGRQPCAPSDEWVCIVPGRILSMLLEVGNRRFAENTRRIARFKDLLAAGVNAIGPKLKADGTEWEDAAARRERKRAEGLKRSQGLKTDLPNLNP